MYALILVYLLGGSGMSIAVLNTYQTIDSCTAAGTAWQQAQTMALRVREFTCLPVDKQ